MRIDGNQRFSTISEVVDAGAGGVGSQYTFTGATDNTMRWEVNLRVRECKYLHDYIRHEP